LLEVLCSEIVPRSAPGAVSGGCAAEAAANPTAARAATTAKRSGTTPPEGLCSAYDLAPAALGEALLTLGLLVKGVNEQHWKEQASARSLSGWRG